MPSRSFVNCVDMAPLLTQEGGATLTAAEDECVVTASRTDDTFVQLLANEFRGVKSPSGSAELRFGAAVVACLSPQNRLKVLASPG